MKTYEYKHINGPLYLKELQKLGRQGWLLVSTCGIANYGDHILVREVTP